MTFDNSSIGNSAICSSSIDPGSLEGVVLSGRYCLIEKIGQGAWGTIYKAMDVKLNIEPIAVKVLNPAPIAKEQADYRGIDIEENFLLKESRRGLEACGHLVRRYADTDKDKGVSYVVMNLYSETLQERLNRIDRIAQINKDLAIHWMSDIVSAIAEYHEIYDSPHCDIKPDNIVIDNKRGGRLLLTDFGSSTTAVPSSDRGPRDNIGFIYSRAPGNFIKGSHPSRSYDCYAAGSILFRLFTGKYMLEEEIDQALKAGQDDLNELMAGLLSCFRVGAPSRLESLVDAKMVSVDIPDQFKDFIRSAVLERYWDGRALKSAFDESRRSYDEAKIKKSVVDEYKNKLRNACLASFLGASVLGAAVSGFAWITFFAPQPDPRKREDIESAISVRRASDSSIVFSMERACVKPAYLGTGRESRNAILQVLDKNYNKDSLSYLITKQYFLTSEDMGDNPEFRDLMARFSRISFRRDIITGTEENWLMTLIPHYAGLERLSLGPGRDMSLESLLTSILFGSARANALKESSRSFKFDQYIDARDKDGRFMVSRESKKFLIAWIYNVWSALPENLKHRQMMSK